MTWSEFKNWKLKKKSFFKIIFGCMIHLSSWGIVQLWLCQYDFGNLGVSDHENKSEPFAFTCPKPLLRFLIHLFPVQPAAAWLKTVAASSKQMCIYITAFAHVQWRKLEHFCASLEKKFALDQYQGLWNSNVAEQNSCDLSVAWSDENCHILEMKSSFRTRGSGCLTLVTFDWSQQRYVVVLVGQVHFTHVHFQEVHY